MTLMKIRLPKSDNVWMVIVAVLLIVAAASLFAGVVLAGLWAGGAIDPIQSHH